MHLENGLAPTNIGDEQECCANIECGSIWACPNMRDDGVVWRCSTCQAIHLQRLCKEFASPTIHYRRAHCLDCDTIWHRDTKEEEASIDTKPAVDKVVSTYNAKSKKLKVAKRIAHAMAFYAANPVPLANTVEAEEYERKFAVMIREVRDMCECTKCTGDANCTASMAVEVEINPANALN